MAKPDPGLVHDPDPHCGSCANFNLDLTCDRVQGEIDPSCVCDLWTPAAGALTAATPR